MFPIIEFPSLSSLFTAFTSITASIMLFQSLLNQFLPKQVRDYLISLAQRLFRANDQNLTLVFDGGRDYSGNQVYDAAGVYLDTLRSPKTRRLNVRKSTKEKGLTIRLENGEKLKDFFEGIELHWKFVLSEQVNNNSGHRFGSQSSEKRFYELSFHNKHRDLVLNSYIPFIMKKAKIMRDEKRVLKMHTLSNTFDPGMRWESINLEHPATFDTLAMDPKKKSDIIEDLNRFVKRKAFYKKVGRAWKRGYLLYGPPGTGKSSLVAAMANHLKFDIYDLQLGNVQRDCDLRRLLLTTANRSILLIEDIDCSVDLPNRLNGGGGETDGDNKCGDQNDKNPGPSLTLSGLLNFIDGLWSSCGDERIIICTTNHKDRLDPALLRPGRMDMPIYMGYCTYEAFKQLASNYLGVIGDHQFYEHIKVLLGKKQVTPAQVAEEFLKYEDADLALSEFLKLLKGEKLECDDEEMNYNNNKTSQTNSVVVSAIGCSDNSTAPQGPIVDDNWQFE